MPQEPEEFPLRVFSVESEPPNDTLDDSEDPASHGWVGGIPAMEDLQAAFDVFLTGTAPAEQIRALSDLDKSRLAYLREHWLELEEPVRTVISSQASMMGNQEIALDFRRFLIFTLEDPSPVVRQIAIDAFSEFLDEETASLVLSHLMQDPSPDVRAEAASTLAWFVDTMDFTPENLALEQRIRDSLLKVASQPGEPAHVRGLALETFSLFGNGKELQNLIDEFYAEDETGLRSSALFAMGNSNDKRWIPILTSELASKDNETRRVAATALGMHDDPDVLPDLRKLTRDPDRDARHAAILAIGNISGPAAKRILAKLLEGDPDEEDQDVIMEALQMEDILSNFDEDDESLFI